MSGSEGRKALSIRICRHSRLLSESMNVGGLITVQTLNRVQGDGSLQCKSVPEMNLQRFLTG